MVGGTHGDGPLRRWRDRGVGLAEYALGIGFILVASLGSLATLQEESGDAFEARGGAIGTPDLDLPASSTTATTAPPDGPDGSTTTSAPPTPPDSTVASAVATANSSGNKWTATIVISITADGDPVHKVTLTARWQENPGGAITEVSCETQPNGTCTFALRNLATFGNSNHVGSVDFTLLTVTPEGGVTTDPGLVTTVAEP